MLKNKKSVVGLLAGAAIGTSSISAHAAVVFSNVTNSQGSFLAQGATTPIGSPSVDFSPLVADDITPAAGSAGEVVTSITFSVVNGNSTSLSAAPDLRFYASDGASAGPGTILAAINLSAVTVPTSTIELFTLNSSSPGGLFTIPSGSFWAGITFTDGSGATASAAQVANFGQGLFDPPTIGSSANVFFNSSTTTNFTTSNPAGGFFFFGTTPVANFGWAFSATAVPEPTSLGLLTIVGAALLGRRRSPATRTSSLAV
jgi:hypothetical protein